MTYFILLAASLFQIAGNKAARCTISAKTFSAKILSIAASVGVLASGVASAEDVPSPPPTPSLIVRLDGGLPASNLAAILGALASHKVGFRTQSTPVPPGTGTCALLAQAKFPAPCGDFLPVIGQLNPGVNLNALGSISTLTLPDLKIDISSSERLFTRTSDTKKVVNSLVKNWSALNAKVTEERSTEVNIQYDRYTVQLIPDNPDDVMQAARLAVGLQLKNATIEVKGVPSGTTKLFSNSEEDVKSDCESPNVLDRLKTSQRKYVNWFDRDTEADKFIVEPRETVRVQILDTPVLKKMPNLDRAFSTTSPLKCQWAFDKNKHHGNHLASIIASQNNGTGFFGIEPTAQLGSFDIRDPSVNSGRVANYIETTKRSSPESIYLFATGIAEEHLVDAGPGWETRRLPATSTRSSNSITATVSTMRPLLIVAAGQRELPSQSLELSALTNLFPQNLGDFQNVIVVTACRICARGSASLMDGAFQSEAASKFVHVAAPGGTPIPAWTSESSMGAPHGTSQAAAYVAGVAAGMISRYSAVYREPAALKYRLQMCSYPLPAAKPDRSPNIEPNRLAAGVVDPGVCMLDPTKTWVKRNGGWMAVAMKGWTEQTLFLQGTRKIPLNNDDVLRMIRTNEDSIQNTRLALFMDRGRGDAESELEKGFGQVKLVRAGSHSPLAGLTLCDNSVLKLSELDDVLVASQPASCSD